MSNKGIFNTFLSEDGGVRLIFAETTGIVQEAADIHRPSRTVTAALGRCLTAASIMGKMMKTDGGSITLRLAGDGPAGSFICIADCGGNVRGCCDNPRAELPPNALGKLDVGGVIGRNGDLYVVRDYGFGEPYVGHSKLVRGEVAEAITRYYAVSEQTPTVCALGVRLERDGSVSGAGGFFLQLMPGRDEALIARLQANLDAMGSLSQLIADGRKGRDIAGLVFGSLPFRLIEEAEMRYLCACDREKYRRALISLGPGELADMRDSGEEAEIICRFCNTRYAFSTEELGQMYDEAEAELTRSQETL
jgi:molecular chaperone Hsp33